jgi:hypothetical protein
MFRGEETLEERERRRGTFEEGGREGPDGGLLSRFNYSSEEQL